MQECHLLSGFSFDSELFFGVICVLKYSIMSLVTSLLILSLLMAYLCNRTYKLNKAKEWFSFGPETTLIVTFPQFRVCLFGTLMMECQYIVVLVTRGGGGGGCCQVQGSLHPSYGFCERSLFQGLGYFHKLRDIVIE